MFKVLILLFWYHPGRVPGCLVIAWHDRNPGGWGCRSVNEHLPSILEAVSMVRDRGERVTDRKTERNREADRETEETERQTERDT